MRTKTADIYMNILQNDYCVIALTETWLKSDIRTSEFIDSRYIVYRRDRDCIYKLDGGGILLAVNKNFTSFRMQSWESEFEDLWIIVELKINRTIKRIGICVIYMPPPVKMNDLTETLDNINTIVPNVDEVLIVGDFNLSFITWENKEDALYAYPGNYNCNLGYALTDFLSCNELYQFNTIKGADGKIRDLVLSTIHNISVNEPLEIISKLDKLHPPLVISINMNSNLTTESEQNKPRSDYNFFKADYSKIIASLEAIDWCKLWGNTMEVDEMISIFYDKLSSIFNSYIPKHQCKPSSLPIWFKRRTRKLLVEKNKIRARYRTYKNPRDRYEFEILRTRCRVELNDCYREYCVLTEENIQRNSRAFWRFLKEKKQNTSIPSLVYRNNVSASNNVDIANLFAEQFESTFNTSNDSIVRVLTAPSPLCNTLSRINFDEKIIYNKLKKLDIHKASGPDGIPGVFIKRCARVLALPLKLIFNRSLETGTFPTEWKKARVVPVYKKEDVANVANYRPISMLSIFGKVFESLVCPILVEHTKNLVSDRQHGFQNKKSVISNMLNYVTSLNDSLDEGIEVHSVYTDFSNAFDRVNHKILLVKLQYFYGISGHILSWFRSYLKERVQYVVVKGYESRWYKAVSGVPQGSHLGPILFILFINDIVECVINSKCLLFADDMKIFMPIKSTVDIVMLQEDLDRVQEWCTRNGMIINVSKCCFIKITKRKKKFDASYHIDGMRITETPFVRDLGVIIDNKLSFTRHYDLMIEKALKSFGFLRRTCKDLRSPKTRIVIFNALVRSILEYSSVIWNPYQACYSERIERIQRSFTKYLVYNSDISRRSNYQDRLITFKFDTLFNRRRIIDICTLFKILNGMLDCPLILENICFRVPRPGSRAINKGLFDLPVSRTVSCSNSPLPRMLKAYNELSTLSFGCDVDLFHNNLLKLKKTLVEKIRGGI